MITFSYPWECPRCGRMNAPHSNQCVCPPDKGTYRVIHPYQPFVEPHDYDEPLPVPKEPTTGDPLSPEPTTGDPLPEDRPRTTVTAQLIREDGSRGPIMEMPRL
jgi:hypothetical protein